MDDNIFAYDEEEILKDSLIALSKTFDKVKELNNKNIDITESIIDNMNRMDTL